MNHKLPILPIMKSSPRLQSTVYGTITQLLLVEPGISNPYGDVATREIRETLEAHGIEVVVLKNRLDIPKTRLNIDRKKFSLDDPLVAEMLARGRTTEVSVKFDLNRWSDEFFKIRDRGIPLAHSEWAQDGFVVQAYDGLYNVLLQPLTSRRFIDQFISHELAMERSLRLLIRPTTLELEGGNLLAGDNFALIGKNTLGAIWISKLNDQPMSAIRNETATEELFQILCEEIKETLGVEEVIWVGYNSVRRDLFSQTKLTYQPDFHLDLFLTLGGKTPDGEDILFIGDPALGKEIVEREIHRSVEHGLTWEDDLIADGIVFDSFYSELQYLFQDYNSKSTRRKFKLVRLPMLIDNGVVYSYNNCLIEINGAQNKVFLPNYFEDPSSGKVDNRARKSMNSKFEVLNAAAEAIFRSHGFKDIVWTGRGIQMQYFSRRRGSLHCISKVLRRSQFSNVF
jgi:hypothetical protein